MRVGHYCWLARARSSYWGDSYSHYNLAEPSGEPQGPMEAQLAILGIRGEEDRLNTAEVLKAYK